MSLLIGHLHLQSKHFICHRSPVKWDNIITQTEICLLILISIQQSLRYIRFENEPAISTWEIFPGLIIHAFVLAVPLLTNRILTRQVALCLGLLGISFRGWCPERSGQLNGSTFGPACGTGLFWSQLLSFFEIKKERKKRHCFAVRPQHSGLRRKLVLCLWWKSKRAAGLLFSLNHRLSFFIYIRIISFFFFVPFWLVCGNIFVRRG